MRGQQANEYPVPVTKQELNDSDHFSCSPLASQRDPSLTVSSAEDITLLQSWNI